MENVCLEWLTDFYGRWRFVVASLSFSINRWLLWWLQCLRNTFNLQLSTENLVVNKTHNNIGSIILHLVFFSDIFEWQKRKFSILKALCFFFLQLMFTYYFFFVFQLHIYIYIFILLFGLSAKKQSDNKRHPVMSEQKRNEN